MATASDARLLQARLREDFTAFVHKAFFTLCPGQAYDRTWHIKAIAYELERIRSGENRRLIINLPPRSLKSIIVSVAYPAFLLGHDPSLKIICVSYSADLAKKHANDFRALIESPWYRDLFPNTRIGQKNTELEIDFTGKGFRLATSVGGTLTGRGGDLIIIDDPLKPGDAYSEAGRSAPNEWLNNTALSRLDSKETGAFVVVMQRLHLDDLTGFVLAQSDDWRHLSLPAIAEVDEDIPISATAFHHRKRGDVLSPNRESLDVLESIKAQLGSVLFSAQYQQQPVPPGGAMIKRAWIKRYSELPPKAQQLAVVQSWDTANKGGPENDFSVCTTWFVTSDRHWYLADVLRFRADYPTLRSAVINHAVRWNAHQVLIEDAGSGTALLQEVKAQVRGLAPVKPELDKQARMAFAASKFEMGLALLPERAPWLADFETELFAFPGVKHDDQCDSVSQALWEKNFRFAIGPTPEFMAALRRGAPRPPWTPYNSRSRERF